MTKGFQTLLSISTCGATTCPTDDCSGATKFFMESLNSKNQTSTPMMANATYEVCGDSVKLGQGLTLVLFPAQRQLFL